MPHDSAAPLDRQDVKVKGKLVAGCGGAAQIPRMTTTRRDALAQLAALFALPVLGARGRLDELFGAPRADPLAGTIAEFQAGRLRREWSAVEVTTAALATCESRGRALRAIDVLAGDALAAARASDARLH